MFFLKTTKNLFIKCMKNRLFDTKLHKKSVLGTMNSKILCWTLSGISGTHCNRFKVFNFAAFVNEQAFFDMSLWKVFAAWISFDKWGQHCKWFILSGFYKIDDIWSLGFICWNKLRSYYKESLYRSNLYLFI